MYEKFEKNNINLESVVLCNGNFKENDDDVALRFIALVGFIQLIKFY